ncbi:NADH dehydrogenase subunit C [bacterium A37T11]|nr:NADH dehydrogenase subunit C [bacterium A37T11]
MLIEDVRNLICEHIGDDVIVAEELLGLQPALVIKTNMIREVCFLLRDHEQTWFDFLSCLSGVDNGIQAGTFAVVYHLASIPYKTQLTLKVVVPNDRGTTLPVVPSVGTIWKTAEWHEREAFDLVGIFFDGHPDLRRILLPDDWEGYPLRKDYQEAEMYHGISIQ